MPARHLLVLGLGLLAGCSGRRSDGVAPSATSEAMTGSVELRSDLAYTVPGGVPSDLAVLDLYRVADGQDRPVAVLVHGGSWIGGDKSAFRDSAPDFIPWFLDRGYTVAAVNFRLASRVGQPLEVGPMDQASDIAHALAWLYVEADALGITADPALLVGYSSGAHLVALLGADERYLEEAALPADRIAATISLDVHVYDVPYALQLMEGSDVEENIPLILHLFGETEAEQREASPSHHVDGRVAPAMVVSVGDETDRVGSHGQIVFEAATRYAEVLTTAGHHVETVHDTGEDHSSLAIGFGADGDSVTAAVGSFLDALHE